LDTKEDERGWSKQALACKYAKLLIHPAEL
jgi:hypothetical protein